MNNNDITFDSNDVSSIARALSVNIYILNSIMDSINTSFTPFSSIDLFVENISKFSKKIENMKNVHENIVTAIAGQAYTYDNVEDIVSNVADDYMSYYNNSNESINSNMQDVKSEEQIKTTSLEDEVNNADEKMLIELVNFINANKDTDTEFNELLNVEAAQVLTDCIKSFYSINSGTQIDTTTEINNMNVRESFIKKILNTDMNMPLEVKQNSIIEFKQYLSTIANTLNTDFYTLLVDSTYEDVRTTIFLNLYNGTAIGDTNSLEDNYSDEFKELLNQKSVKSNMSTNDLLKNPILLI